MTSFPRPAATLVLMRERGGECEVLLVRRHGGNATAGGAFVFPGGLLEPRDDEAADLGRSAGFGCDQAAEVLGTAQSPERALAYFMAAIRETFEETGILLATEGEGARWRASPSDRAALGEARAALRERRLDFGEWLGQRRLVPAFADLVYFSHWITPEAMARRFDTRFFIAAADADALPEPDGEEVVECRWISPAKAIAAHAARTLSMVNATVKNLEVLAEFAGLEQARERLRGRAIRAILPKAIPQGKEFRIVNPWDPEYDKV